MKKHARSLVRVIEENIKTGDDGNIDYTRLTKWGTDFVGAEVGVWKGELSKDLLSHFPKLYLHMVDLWEEEGKDKSMHGKDSGQDAMSEALQAATANTDFARERRKIHVGHSISVAERIINRELDFVFIDADHYYDSVKADILSWWTKIRFEGVMLGHDYNGQGDRRKGWGVKRAVDEVFEIFKLEVNVEPGLVWWVKKW